MCYGVCDAEVLQGGEEGLADGDGELLGEEFEVVARGLVVQEEGERNLALVGLEDLHERGAEFRREPIGFEQDVEAGDERLAEVAQQRNLLDFKAVRRLLALGALLGLDEVAGGNIAFDVDLRVQLHVGQQGLVVLAEEGEFVRAVEVLHDDARAR